MKGIGKKSLFLLLLPVLLASAACGRDAGAGRAAGAVDTEGNQVAGASGNVIYAYIREINEQTRTVALDEVELISRTDSARTARLGLREGHQTYGGSYVYNNRPQYRLYALGEGLVFDLMDTEDNDSSLHNENSNNGDGFSAHPQPNADAVDSSIDSINNNGEGILGNALNLGGIQGLENQNTQGQVLGSSTERPSGTEGGLNGQAWGGNQILASQDELGLGTNMGQDADMDLDTDMDMSLGLSSDLGTKIFNDPDLGDPTSNGSGMGNATGNGSGLNSNMGNITGNGSNTANTPQGGSIGARTDAAPGNNEPGSSNLLVGNSGSSNSWMGNTFSIGVESIRRSIKSQEDTLFAVTISNGEVIRIARMR